MVLPFLAGVFYFVSGIIQGIADLFNFFPAWAKFILAGLLFWFLGIIEFDVPITGPHVRFALLDDLIKLLFQNVGMSIDSTTVGIGLFACGLIVLLLAARNSFK